jgi:hypothetical protein
MTSVMPSHGPLVVGTSGSPVSLPASRYSHDLVRRNVVPLVAVLAWIPPGGDLAERRWPSPYLRHGKVSRYCLAHAPCAVLAIPLARAAEIGLQEAASRLRAPAQGAAGDGVGCCAALISPVRPHPFAPAAAPNPRRNRNCRCLAIART